MCPQVAVCSVTPPPWYTVDCQQTVKPGVFRRFDLRPWTPFESPKKTRSFSPAMKSARVSQSLQRLCVCPCRDHIFRQSTELVCRAYGEIYAALSSPANGYKDPEQLVPRSPKQVQTLLSWETLCPPWPVKYVQCRYIDGLCKSWLVGEYGM